MNINYTAANDILIEGVYKDETFEIKFSDIKLYWQYATEEDFEGGKAKICGKYVFANILTANGQDGIIFVWDIEQKKVVNFYEGDYCIDFVLRNDEIYSLHYFAYWGISPYFQMRKLELKTNQSNAMMIDFPFDTDVYSGNAEIVSMSFKDDKILTICFGDNKYFVAI